MLGNNRNKMFQPNKQLERLTQFREKLGLNKSEMAEQLGLKQRAYAFYEAGERKIPPEMMDSLARLGLNLHWFATGQGEMMAVTGSASIQERPDTMAGIGSPTPYYLPTPGFPEKEIVRATELVVEMAGYGNLSPYKLGGYIAAIAEMLVLGESESEVRRVQGPAIRALAYSESKRPPRSNPL